MGILGQVGGDVTGHRGAGAVPDKENCSLLLSDLHGPIGPKGEGRLAIQNFCIPA
jgi:hypothetical protein